MAFRFLLAALPAIWLLSACTPQPQGGGGGRPLTRVVVEPVVLQPLEERIELVGTLRAVERIDVASEIAGPISALFFDHGDFVEAEAVLVEIDDEKLAARFAAAQASFDLAQTSYNRNEQLLVERTIPQQTFDESESRLNEARAALELARQELGDTIITAPFDGQVGLRNVSVGQFVQPGQALTTLVQFDPIMADFDVPERFLSELGIGQTVRLSVAAYPGETFPGRVIFVSPEVQELTRNIQVRAQLENADARLKPGMFTGLQLTLEVRDEAMVIPEEALVLRSAGPVVFTVNDEDQVGLAPVQTGVRIDGAVEILSGLTTGQRVITEGHQKVGPGMPVAPNTPEA